MTGSFSHFRSQLKCYLLSKTLLIIQVCKNLLPHPCLLFSPWHLFTLFKALTFVGILFVYSPKSINPMRIVVSLDHCCIPRPLCHAQHIMGFYNSLQNKWEKNQENCFSTRKWKHHFVNKWKWVTRIMLYMWQHKGSPVGGNCSTSEPKNLFPSAWHDGKLEIPASLAMKSPRKKLHWAHRNIIRSPMCLGCCCCSFNISEVYRERRF